MNTLITKAESSMNEYSEKQLPSTGFINRLCMAGILLLVFAAYLSLGELFTKAI